ncbi:MAG TPA: hydrogen peroxide-inducible genes activator [Crocinitomix sp.]|nr:hydrogen peroxide-inducible genes activator [Crocinitomix sp.]
MITLQQLEYIVAVDKYRHFVTASEHCFVTQPTLSMQIKKLEDRLNVVIFDRSKQPIVPTIIGAKIIEQAKEVLYQSRKINEIIKDEENSISGDLSIGIIPSLAPYLLPKFIGNFSKKYPQLNISINEMLSEDIINTLKNDEIDVGLLVTPLNEKGIFETPLFYEEILLYVNPNHPFAKAKEVFTYEIATEKLWLMSEGNCFRTQVINLCDYSSKLEESKHFKFESGSLETIVNIVNYEGGYTLLPELATIDVSKKGIVKSFANIKPLREVGMVTSRTNVKSKILELFAEEIKTSVPQNLLDANNGKIVYWR